MSIDRYSSCPGGTGKKVKFCCSDLVSELEKVQRMLQGRQNKSCLDYVLKLESTHPGRACLLTCKLALEQALHDNAAAETTLRQFLELHPANPIALAESAIGTAKAGDAPRALLFMQKALQSAGQELPREVFSAIGRLAEMMLFMGFLLPARGLLALQTVVNRADPQGAVELLRRLVASPSVPVLFKDVPLFSIAPRGVPWEQPFNQGAQLAINGRWSEAAGIWNELAPLAGDEPALWRNLAIARSYMADYAGAVHAFRTLSLLNVPREEAIEAEASAQLLAKGATEGIADELVVPFAVADLDKLQAVFESHAQSERTDVDPQDFPDETPPRAIYALLDRPTPPSGIGISRDDIPHVVAEVLLFDAAEDEPARIELEAYRPHLAAAEELLRQIASDHLGERGEEEAIGQMSAVELALSWQWRLPDDTPEAHRRKLLSEQRRRMVLEVWPKLPMPLFDNKTPEEAAQDPRQAVPLAAAILLLELDDSDPAADEICDELRRRLGVPVPEQIDPAQFDLAQGRLSRFSRLDFKAMDERQLRQIFQRAVAAQYETAIRRMAPEILARESNAFPELQLAAHQSLARLEDDLEQAQMHLAAANELARRLQRPPSERDLEISARIAGRRGSRMPIGGGRL